MCGYVCAKCVCMSVCVFECVCVCVYECVYVCVCGMSVCVSAVAQILFQTSGHRLGTLAMDKTECLTY